MPDTDSVANRPLGMLPSAVAYVTLVGIPVLLVLLLLPIGEGLPPAAGAIAIPRAAGQPSFDLALLTIQIVVIVAAARLAGGAMQRIGQPRVIGEMIAGLMLGPSVLGLLAPSTFHTLFPVASLGFLNALAQVGLLLFMFLVGLELDPKLLRNRGHTAVLTSHASILAPFLLGTALALPLYSRFAPSGVGFTPFALFMGAAMSVTAFPVLARILADRGMTGTRLGAIAIACAAVDDVTAWCILAAVVLVARAGEMSSLIVTLAGTAVYVAVMMTLGRRLLARIARLAQRGDEGMQGFLAAVLIVTLTSAWITERLGIHALFGAFLVGALLPRDAGVVHAITSRLRDVMIVLLLPLFFAFTGLRTTVALVSGGTLWAFCALVLLVAIAGKLGGSAVAARATGMPWREALSLGALMNTRGLMELVILNVGLDIGVMSPTLFAMMVIMALVTTGLTTPMLDLLQRNGSGMAQTSGSN
jgi:Kef-type K+ transport system membrane component KefB